MENYRVNVIEMSTDKIVKSYADCSQRKAMKLKAGIEINLNHAQYEIVIVRDK